MRTSARELLAAAPTLSVGVLTADLLRLGDELGALDAAGITLAHVDVMDGVFCPQLTVGAPFVCALPDRFVKDVHLMVEEPLEPSPAAPSTTASRRRTTPAPWSRRRGNGGIASRCTSSR